MTRALSLGIVILEELALVIASILLIGLLAVWIVSEAIQRLHYATFYRFFAKHWKGERCTKKPAPDARI